MSYIILLTAYARSPFRDFESHLRVVVGSDEDDIQLILKQYNPNFVTYGLDPANYTVQDLQEAVYLLGDHEGTFQIEYDDINKKTEPTLSRFDSTFGTLRFDEKSFYQTLLGYTPFWDYKPTNAIHADSAGVNTSDKILNLIIINETRLKCACIEGSIVNGVRKPILFTFALDKPSGYKVFCKPETIHYKKIKKSVLNTTTFCLEDNNNEEVDLNVETLTFTLQMIKSLYNMFT